jgi:hypothetical protein
LDGGQSRSGLRRIGQDSDLATEIETVCSNGQTIPWPSNPVNPPAVRQPTALDSEEITGRLPAGASPLAHGSVHRRVGVIMRSVTISPVRLDTSGAASAGGP